MELDNIEIHREATIEELKSQILTLPVVGPSGLKYRVKVIAIVIIKHAAGGCVSADSWVHEGPRGHRWTTRESFQTATADIAVGV